MTGGDRDAIRTAHDGTVSDEEVFAAARALRDAVDTILGPLRRHDMVRDAFAALVAQAPRLATLMRAQGIMPATLNGFFAKVALQCEGGKDPAAARALVRLAEVVRLAE